MTPPHSPCRRYVAGGTMSAASAIPRQSDGGGSNASRVRLWKRELQRLANELGIEIAAHHLPPGTSKWNKIESIGCSRSSPWTGAPSRWSATKAIATTTKAGLKL